MTQGTALALDREKFSSLQWKSEWSVVYVGVGDVYGVDAGRPMPATYAASS